VVVRYEGRFVERRILEYAGRELSGYQAPLLVPGSGAPIDLDELWRAIQLAAGSECDKALLRYLPAAAAPSWGRSMGEPTPVLDLRSVASFEELLSRCSANHRGDVKRRFRRLRERGRVEFHVASAAEIDWVRKDLADRFLVQHALLCREKRYPDPFGASEAFSFLESVFSKGLEEGWAFYGSLLVEGESIAWILGLVHERELYWWRPAYHSEWKEYSPGKVLLASTLEHAIARGLQRVHFHAGAQPYKLAWKPNLPGTSSVSWYARGVRSSTLAWYDRLAGTR
jgi:CelD/BcsL family acetyltransferase involved in cellulose biosynthesis